MIYKYKKYRLKIMFKFNDRREKLNQMKKEKAEKKEKKDSSQIKWFITIFITTFILSILFSFISTTAINGLNLIPAVIVLIIVILIRNLV